MPIQDIALLLTGATPATSLGSAGVHIVPYTGISVTGGSFGASIWSTNIPVGTANVVLEHAVSLLGGDYRLSMDGGATFGSLASFSMFENGLVLSADTLSWMRVYSLTSGTATAPVQHSLTFTDSSVNNLFDNINAVENVGGDSPEFRAIDVRSYYAGIIPMSVYVASQPIGGAVISLGISTTPTQIANEKVAPAGVIFGSYPQSNPLSLGNQGNGSSIQLWVRRQAPGNNLTALNQAFTLSFTG